MVTAECRQCDAFQTVGLRLGEPVEAGLEGLMCVCVSEVMVGVWTYRIRGAGQLHQVQ